LLNHSWPCVSTSDKRGIFGGEATAGEALSGNTHSTKPAGHAVNISLRRFDVATAAGGSARDHGGHVGNEVSLKSRLDISACGQPTVTRLGSAAAVSATGTPWGKNSMRHSFASYHVSMHQNAPKTSLEMGHDNPDQLFQSYRNVVKARDAESS
jgi:hypothetical protein